jgi:hypothetical protein
MGSLCPGRLNFNKYVLVKSALLMRKKPVPRHTAYDINIVGIDPDYKVHIRDDILQEVDGPMLEHGIKEMNMRSLWIPPTKSKQPDRERLAQRFAVFHNQ